MCVCVFFFSKITVFKYNYWLLIAPNYKSFTPYKSLQIIYSVKSFFGSIHSTKHSKNVENKIKNVIHKWNDVRNKKEEKCKIWTLDLKTEIGMKQTKRINRRAFRSELREKPCVQRERTESKKALTHWHSHYVRDETKIRKRNLNPRPLISLF